MRLRPRSRTAAAPVAVAQVKLLDLGIVLDFFGRALFEDAPVVHHGDPLRDAPARHPCRVR